MYILDTKLQNDQKFPGWNRCTYLGQFLGFSNEHSSLVKNVRNLPNIYISPQYHVVFEDFFILCSVLGRLMLLWNIFATRHLKIIVIGMQRRNMNMMRYCIKLPHCVVFG